MPLTEEDIQEFVELWKTEFGEQLSPDDARLHATALLELFLLLCSPGGFEPRISNANEP